MSRRRETDLRGIVAALVALVLTACATQEPTTPAYRPLTAAEGRALVARLLPERVADRQGWAVDLYAGIAALDLAPTVDNMCAVIAVTEQESGFRADPAVPGLPAITWREIERQRERAGI